MGSNFFSSFLMNVFSFPNFLWLKMTSDTWIIRVRVLYERGRIGFISYKSINFTSSSTTFAAILGNLNGKNPCIAQFNGLNLKVCDVDVRCTLKNRDQDVWATTPLFYPLDEVFLKSEVT